MQDNTYLPRNFATLGSLELQPPVFTDYTLQFYLLSFPFVNLGKRHCAYFIIYFAHSCVCGQQLQGYFCRVPFKWFFASLKLKSLGLVLVWFLLFHSFLNEISFFPVFSFFSFFHPLFTLKVRYQLTLMCFHSHQKPRFYGQRAFISF